ncbi:MAG: DUF6785 family protein [Candidatus Latescibacterota bacterium]
MGHLARPFSPRRSLRWRALCLGLGLVVLISVGTPYTIWIVGSSEITWSYFPIGAGAPFVFLVFGNGLLRRFRPSWALTPADFVVILSMGLVATSIPNFVVGYLLAVISKPYYGATPENEWEGYVQPFLPDWAIPGTQAIRPFYEGLASGQSIPFGAWLGPLAWWLSLILAVYWVCFCLVVLMRRQWVEHERLAFPLTEVPRLLVEEEPGSVLPRILQDRAFRLGCALPVGVILFNVISFFHPGFPQLALYSDHPVEILRGVPAINLILYFPVVGFMYLVSSSISFSIWFFYLVGLLETGVITWAGLTTTPDAFVWGSTPTLSWQGFGAFAAMVLWSLWMGRHHLAAACRQVFGNRREVDDAEEMLSYRVAGCGALAGVFYIIAWLWRSGMDLHVAVLFLLGVLVVYLGITRLVIQSGVYYLTTPVDSQALVLAITGTAINPHNLVALSLSYAWCGDIQSVFMPSAAHAARLNELTSRRRALARAIGLAVGVGFSVTVLFMLYLCYRYGAGNFRSWIFDPGAGAGGIALDAVVRQVRDPISTDWGKLGYMGFGALVYSVLSVCQYRFAWWPLHPVGLALASVWMIQRIALSIFIAWLAKSATLRLGGVALYRRLRPFFIGLIAGFYAGVGISFVVDCIWFFGKGHFILNG